MGYEGAAARIYFQRWGNLLILSLHFLGEISDRLLIRLTL